MAIQPTSKREITVQRANGYAAQTYAVPTKFTPEVRKSVLDSLANGHYKTTAFAIAGISQGAFNSWMKKGMVEPGEPGYDEEFHQFYLDVLKAEGKAEDFAVRTWFDAASEDWKAASAFLAARFPGRWASRTKVEVSGDGEGGPIQFTISMDTMRDTDKNPEDVTVDSPSIQEIELELDDA